MGAPRNRSRAEPSSRGTKDKKELDLWGLFKPILILVIIVAALALINNVTPPPLK